LTQHQLVWFKRDLRLWDHAPLWKACHAGGTLCCVYIVEPEYWQLPDSSHRHWHFIWESLHELQEKLRDHGHTLRIFTGNTVEIFAYIHQQLGPFTLWSHQETGNAWTFQRDLAVKAWAKTHNIRWNEYDPYGIVRPLKNRDLWQAHREQMIQQPVYGFPELAHVLPVSPDLVPLHTPPSQAYVPPRLDDLESGVTQQGGRKAPKGEPLPRQY
jgi:deoxyribodipyrimidine photo-lyase